MLRHLRRRIHTDVDLGDDRLYANRTLRGPGTRHLSDEREKERERESRGRLAQRGRGERAAEILYLIAISRTPVLPPGMLLVKSHQSGVKTIYILP